MGNGLGGIFGWGSYAADNTAIALRFNHNFDSLTHYWFGQDLQSGTLPSSLADGEWHFVVVSWNGTARQLYVDSTTPVASGEVMACLCNGLHRHINNQYVYVIAS